MSIDISNPIKIYHIVHLDKLCSIIQSGGLFCDEIISRQCQIGTTIGMSHIKERRQRNAIPSYPDLMVGQCVPFYFCPRSVMLFLIHKGSCELSYQGGQALIVHLVADMKEAVNWAEDKKKRWVFTTSNAGAFYFDSYHDLSQLEMVDWKAVNATDWRNCKEGKQAEFLVEDSFPWELIEEIGVYSAIQQKKVSSMLATLAPAHCPAVSVRTNWYY